MKSENANLTESEAQELVWKEFNSNQTKVKEVPSFELNNPILDKMKKSREVHLNTCNKNEKSEPKIGPAIEKAKSDQPAENIKQNGNRQLSPAPRK